MNLRVDLILPSERRDGSVLSVRSLSRIGSIVGPLLVVCLIGMAAAAIISRQRELSIKEGDYQQVLPRKNMLMNMSSDFEENRQIRQDLAGWRAARVSWQEQTEGLMRSVPARIQISKVLVSQSFGAIDETTPARIYSAIIEGKTSGEGAEQRVQILRQRLSESPVFTERMETVAVQKYGADTSRGADKADRVFVIKCTYVASPFE